MEQLTAEALASVSIFHRDVEWVKEHLATLAALNTVCFLPSPWNERWSMDPDGTNPRTNSFAMFREFISGIDGKPFFVSAELDTEEGNFIVGLGLSLELSEAGCKSLHLEEFGAKPGDYYFALVMVAPEAQGHGIFHRLREARLVHGLELGARTMWVQTHIDQRVVVEAYKRLGFEVVGEKWIDSVQLDGELAPSHRVFLRHTRH